MKAVLKAKKAKNPQGGFSLIEVIIAVMVLSFGLLGLAGLQARAMNAEAESYGRMQAVLMLQDLATRISTNPDSYVGKGAALSTEIFGTSYTGSAPGGLTDPAKTDLLGWSSRLTSIGNLPEARGCIKEGDDSRELIISVAWRGRDSAASPAADDIVQNCAAAPISSNRRVVVQRIRLPDPNT